jgi:protein TonB
MNNKHQPDPDLSSGQIPFQDSVIVIPFGEEEDKSAEIEEPEKPEEPPKTEDKKVTETESTTISETTTTTAESSTATTTAETGTLETTGETEIPSKGKTGNPLGTPDTSVVNQPFEVDSLPQYEGGLGALSRFVSQNLKYPNWAFNEGKEGTVFVKFVVDEHGKVGRLSLLNSAGYGMDDEALRVVGLIPKFKSPAKVKGVAVKAYYQMPIRFRFSKY